VTEALTPTRGVFYLKMNSVSWIMGTPTKAGAVGWQSRDAYFTVNGRIKFGGKDVKVIQMDFLQKAYRRYPVLFPPVKLNKLDKPK